MLVSPILSHPHVCLLHPGPRRAVPPQRRVQGHTCYGQEAAGGHAGEYRQAVAAGMRACEAWHHQGAHSWNGSFKCHTSSPSAIFLRKQRMLHPEVQPERPPSTRGQRAAAPTAVRPPLPHGPGPVDELTCTALEGVARVREAQVRPCHADSGSRPCVACAHRQGQRPTYFVLVMASRGCLKVFGERWRVGPPPGCRQHPLPTVSSW